MGSLSRFCFYVIFHYFLSQKEAMEVNWVVIEEKQVRE